MAEQPLLYKPSHPREELSLELNFRSFMSGEGAPFFQPVPFDEILTFAQVGCPITIPAAGPYSEAELFQIAEAAQKGGGDVTLLHSEQYSPQLIEQLAALAPGRIKRG